MGEPGQPLPPCPHCRAVHPEDVLLCPNTNRMLALEGRLLDGRFRFVRKLGEGGMSTVWMAENIRVRKRVAIKLMHPEYARNPRTLHRFQNEATAAGRIGNPHICDILDFGEPPLAVLIICEALKGLMAAHAAGIIHRDLKPENVFLHEPESGRMLVKLMDFGISKFTEDTGGGRTGANVVMGTPEYMSPEQAAGAANVDARTDIWAMGVMLYRAISGVEPFRGKTMAALLLALSTEDHPPITQHVPELPPGLVAVIDRCLAKDPKYRFGSASELFAALTPFQQAVAAGERPQAPIRTGKTMAVPVGMIPTQPPAGTGYNTTAPANRSVDVTAPTGPVPALSSGPSPASSARTVVNQRGPNPSLAQQLPPPRSVDDSPTGSNPNGANTWSTELNPNAGGADQSWSMGGSRTFNDGDEHQRQSSSGGGRWMGWVIGLGVVALLGGGFGVAWSLGVFEGGGKRVAKGDSGGDETGVVAAESGASTPPDLPSGGETGGKPGDTGASTDAGPDSGASAEGGASTDGGGSGGSAGDSGGSAGDSGGSAGDSGGSAGDSGGSAGDSGGSAGDSGGEDEGGEDSGGATPVKDPPFEPSALIKSGNLYTQKAHGPNGDFDSAKKYCRNLKRKKRHGLSGWRMAIVSELQSFRGTEVSKLLYWSSEEDGSKAKAVSMVTGRAEARPLTDPAPRVFCVSKR
jgi:serine/threonine protein kinase